MGFCWFQEQHKLASFSAMLEQFPRQSLLLQIVRPHCDVLSLECFSECCLEIIWLRLAVVLVVIYLVFMDLFNQEILEALYNFEGQELFSVDLSLCSHRIACLRT